MDIADIVTRYLAAWNQTDAAARAEALAALVAPEARYVDPLADVTGPEELGALIGAVQDRFAGYSFSLYGAVDTHHDTARFRWALGPAGAAEPVVIGMDVITVDAGGQVSQVLGFLDRVPATLG